MKAVTVRQAQRLDLLAQRRYKIPEVVQMELAGQAVAQAVLKIYRRPGRVWVVCGSGNNGGDGLVVARHLDNHGVAVSILLAGHPPKDLKSATGINWQIVKALKIPVVKCQSLRSVCAQEARLKRARVIVDALLGVGLKGKLRPQARGLIKSINQAKRPVVAIDVPSGLDAETGCIQGVAVKAKRTVTCGRVKRGLLKRKAKRVVGQLLVADISLPRRLR